MIIFAIPLRSKESSHSWDEVERRFNETLASIFNQKECDAYKCIVACNEVPQLYDKYDDRLEFIQMDLPTPTEWVEMARDKFWKLTRIAVRCREILEEQDNPEQGIYVMPVDADDLLSNRIAKYCDDFPNENGLVAGTGYVWRLNKQYMINYKRIDTFCGSCNIIKMYRKDLPEAMPYDDSYCHDKKVAGELNNRYPIRFDHNTIVDRYRAEGKAFKQIPFKTTIYRLGTGDNISSIYHGERSNFTGKRFHPVVFLRKMIGAKDIRFITPKIRNEFKIEI